MQEDTLKSKIQELLEKEITSFSLKGRGVVNNAYLAETNDGNKYIIKVEREDKEFQPQNSLGVEAGVIQKLSSLSISSPLPKVAFVSENPSMYGYEYIEGDLLRGVWPSLLEEEKVNICQALGRFHSEIGKVFTKDMAKEIGIKIDDSLEIHPESAKDNEGVMASEDVPESFKVLTRKAQAIFEETKNTNVFQFIHNDSHHENILIKDKKISGIIDFGNAEYGEVAKEFSRYIRDFPEHFQNIVTAYERKSGHKLSLKRLISYSFLSGLIDNVESYRKGGAGQIVVEKAISTYEALLEAASF